MKVGGYYYRYEDPTAILASPQEAEPSVAENAQPRANDVDAMVQEIQADTTLHVTGIRQAWTGLRTEASDGVPVVGFDTTWLLLVGRAIRLWLPNIAGFCQTCGRAARRRRRR